MTARLGQGAALGLLGELGSGDVELVQGLVENDIPLNVAEGAYSRGRNRQARFQSAAASAREALACLETAEALGFFGPIEPEIAALFHRVIGTLVRLSEPRQ